MPRSARVRRTSSRASSAVRSISMLASAFSRNHSTGGSAASTAASARRLKSRRWRRTVASRSGRPESGHLAACRVVVDVVHPGQPGDVAEDAVVRPGDPAQQVEDGQPDRHGMPYRTSKARHRHGRGQCQQEFAAPEPGQPAELARRRSAGSRRRSPRRPEPPSGRWPGPAPGTASSAARPWPARPASTAGSGCRERRRAPSGCRCC